MHADTALPPGPAWPRALQSFAWWTRPLPFFERCRARYGARFTLRLLGNVPIVNLTDPDEIRAVFTAPPDVLHPGEGAGFLEPIVGRHSVILLDGAAHMRQRKLLLPAFHGDRMRGLADLMTEVAEAGVAAWPRDEATPLHPRLQTLTLDIILRAVFGLDAGDRLELLRERLGALLASAFVTGDRLAAAARIAAPSAYARFAALQRSVDTDLRKLIDERRASAVRGRDVLAMLLDAQHADGSPMSDDEILDELMTLLVAGHETTASGLAWAFALLVRTPAILGRVVHAIESDDDAYLTATIQETLRRRPVLPTAAPRLVKQPFKPGSIDYPPGVSLAANAYLVHHDPKNYADPYAFRPERFLDEPPGTYTWIPFGGGRRRCLGASFAQLEMQTVLRAVLGRWDIRPASRGRPERAARRWISITPARGATTMISSGGPLSSGRH